MTLSLAWISTLGPGGLVVLKRLGLRDTRVADENNQAPITGSGMAYGWYVIVLRDINHPFTEEDSLKSLSRDDADVVCCQFDMNVMTSSVRCYHGGAWLWSVCHDGRKDIYHLTYDGELPHFFKDIYAKAKAKQDSAGGRKADTDHIFEVPLLTAKQRCGYYHGGVWEMDWGDPRFTILEPVTP